MTKTLEAAARQQPPPREMLLADGGSVDRTAELAKEAKARVVPASRGRGLQLNAGAAAATGSVFLFLHADTELPPGALAAVEAALVDPKVLGGCFQLRFDGEEKDWVLRLWGWCTRRGVFQTSRLVFGDRGIFVRRAAFQALGGYTEWPILEDVDFAMRLRQLGGWRSFAYLQLDVVTSARRLLETGPLRQQLLNSFILFCWYLGFSPEALRSLYRYRQAGLCKAVSS